MTLCDQPWRENAIKDVGVFNNTKLQTYKDVSITLLRRKRITVPAMSKSVIFKQ